MFVYLRRECFVNTVKEEIKYLNSKYYSYQFEYLFDSIFFVLSSMIKNEERFELKKLSDKKLSIASTSAIVPHVSI